MWLDADDAPWLLTEAAEAVDGVTAKVEAADGDAVLVDMSGRLWRLPFSPASFLLSCPSFSSPSFPSLDEAINFIILLDLCYRKTPLSVCGR